MPIAIVRISSTTAARRVHTAAAAGLWTCYSTRAEPSAAGPEGNADQPNPEFGNGGRTVDEAFAVAVEAIEWFDSCEEEWRGELPIASAAVPTLVAAGDACS